jgi:hypothetical protein
MRKMSTAHAPGADSALCLTSRFLPHHAQNVDHAQAMFQLRYLINQEWYDAKNPAIFFYTGNEGPIDLFAANTGFLWETAKEMKAMVIFAEVCVERGRKAHPVGLGVNVMG